MKPLGLTVTLATLLLALANPASAANANYHFTVHISQGVAGGTPTITGTLMLGCTPVLSIPNRLVVSCTPPVPPPQGAARWSCDRPGTIAFADTGSATADSVTAHVQCQNGPNQLAVANPRGFNWNLHLGTDYDFPFVCDASFTAGATGSVYCGEPDP